MKKGNNNNSAKKKCCYKNLEYRFVDNEICSFKNAPMPLKKRKIKIERAITQLFEKKKKEKIHNLHTDTENLNTKL